MLLALSGCGQPWELDATHSDGPWCGPNKRASVLTRQKDPKGLLGGPVTKHALRDAGGNIYPCDSLFHSADKFLEREGYLNQWHSFEWYVNEFQLHLAPYKIYLVSIEPIVVVLISHDYGNLKDKVAEDIVGKRPTHNVQSQYLINHIKFGTQIPFSSSAVWFSPSMNQSLTKLSIENGVGTIELPSGRLIFTQVDDIWKIERE